MLKRMIGASLLAAFFLGGGIVGTAQKLHPKLKKRETALHTIMLIPAKVSLVKDTVKGGEGMLKESEAIEREAQKLVLDSLTAKGFKVVDGQVPSDSSGNNEELRYALADIQGKYDEIQVKVQNKKKDVEKGRFTLGDQVTKLGAMKEVDAIVFIRASGNVKTAGKAFLGALAGQRGGSQLSLTIGIVDARNGDLLYFDERSVIAGLVGTKFHEKPDKALKKPVEKALKKIPPPAQRAGL